jgi:hypothetical protein
MPQQQQRQPQQQQQFFQAQGQTLQQMIRKQLQQAKKGDIRGQRPVAQMTKLRTQKQQLQKALRQQQAKPKRAALTRFFSGPTQSQKKAQQLKGKLQTVNRRIAQQQAQVRGMGFQQVQLPRQQQMQGFQLVGRQQAGPAQGLVQGIRRAVVGQSAQQSANRARGEQILKNMTQKDKNLVNRVYNNIAKKMTMTPDESLRWKIKLADKLYKMGLMGAAIKVANKVY